MSETRKKTLEQILKSINEDSRKEENIHLLIEEKVSKVTSEEGTKLSQKAADFVADFVGSWKFIIFLAVFLITWMGLNVYFAKHAFDAYPFILLNLILSCIAAVQSPLIMMSQNRKEKIYQNTSWR